MPCYRPLNAWQSPAGGPVVFSPTRSHTRSLQIPCGQCIGCRVEKARQWATRCTHEAQLHDENCFITLTYDDEHLPWDGSLNKTHFQNFMKRLRFKYRPKPIRYFHCGEYGEQLKRPHYHALLFGHDFADKTLWAERDGIKTWTSEELASIWPFGFSTIGNLTWETAAYCARYTTKKKTGADAQEHYWGMLATDLEVRLEPEYATMSLKPAIGKEWYDTYKTDCYPSDYVTVKGRKYRIPKYYDKLLDNEDAEQLEAIKAIRRAKAEERHEENTGKRLRAREAVALAKLKTLNRTLELKK